MTTYGQIYATRVANLISIITLGQTGKRYYKNQLNKKQSSAEEEPKSDTLLTGMMNKGNTEWDEEKK